MVRLIRTSDIGAGQSFGDLYGDAEIDGIPYGRENRGAPRRRKRRRRSIAYVTAKPYVPPKRMNKGSQLVIEGRAHAGKAS